MLLALVLGVGNMWAAVIDLTPDAEVAGTNKKWKEVGGGYVSRNGGGFTISTDGLQTGSGNTYVVFDVAAASTIEAKFINTSTTAYPDKTICCGKVSSTQWTAITNAASDGTTEYILSIESGNKLTDQTISLPGTKSATTSCTFTATVAGKYAVYWTSSINNKVRLYEIEITASCDAGDPGNINIDSFDPATSTITIKAAGSAKTGDVWYWQTSATGTSTDDAYVSSGKEIKAAGTYYLRSYNTAGKCWSDAKSIEIAAADFVVKYAVTKGTHVNGDFTISPTSQGAGEEVELEATPDDGYLLDFWSITKTEDGSATGITVTNDKFTMPAYAVTVNATFKVDPCYHWGVGTSNTTAPAAGSSVSVNTKFVLKNVGSQAPYSGTVFSGSGTVSAFNPNGSSNYVTGTLSGDAISSISVSVSTPDASATNKKAFVVVFSSADEFSTSSIIQVKVADEDVNGYVRDATATSAARSNYDFDCPAGTKSFAIGRNISGATIEGAGGSSSRYVYHISVCPAASHAVTYALNGATGTTPTQADVAEGAKFTLHNGTTGITAPANKKFDGWYDGNTKYAGGAKYTMGGDDVELTAQWADAYAVTYVPNNGVLPAETMTDSNSPYLKDAEVTLLANAFTAPDGKEFDAWVVTKTAGGEAVAVTDGKFTMPAEAVTATATWKDRAAHADATLSDLTVGGTTVTGFSASTTSYNVELPFGTFAAPTVAATANDAEYVKSVVVTQASSANGDATVVVTAEDGTTTKTYTVHFSVEASKDIELVWATDKKRCDNTQPTAVVKSNNEAVSTYINQITFTNVEGDGDDGAEGSSLNVGKKAGNMFTLTAKAGYAFKAMTFFAKINDATCEFSLDGGEWTTLTSTNTSSDACYSDIFSETEVHEFRLRSTATKGVWIRNMQLTMIQACTPKTIAWTTAPAAEYEVGKSGYAIAANANNGTVTYAATGDAITVNVSTGALTINSLTNDIDLSASVPAGDGTLYCATPASVVKEEIKTYYLVTFDAQNETAATPVKYYSGDEAIALPNPSYPGFVFKGWFDAATGGTQITEAITPTASRTVYAQWEAQCAGPTITVQPASADYLTGRTAAALACTATAGAAGELTYSWYSCDDAERTNPVLLTGAPTPSTAAVGTFYYYCTVQEAGCDVVRTSNVAVVTITEKDPVCIIKATPSSATEATADGAYKGSAAIKSSGKKLSSKYDYVAVQLMAGKSFLATDKVVLNQAADLGDASDITKFYIFTEVPADGKTYVTVDNASPEKGDNWFTMPAEMAGESSLYIGRVDAKCNPTVGYLAVYRVMAPILSKITVNGVEGTPNALNAIEIEVPAVTTQSQLEAIAYDWVSNNDAWTAAHTPVATNAWAFGVANTVTLTDKDGDESVYTITVNKAAAIKEVVVSGTLSIKEGETTTLSAVVYDTNDNEASIQNVTWSVKSGDESLAEVSAAGVVTGKAAGTAHIIATSVADDSKSAEVEVVISENSCRVWSNPDSKTTTYTIGKMVVKPIEVEDNPSVTPYSGAEATKSWKLSGRNTKGAEIYFSDGAQFESLTLGVTSNGDDKNYTFAVALSTAAGDDFAAGFINVTVYESVDRNEPEALINVALPEGQAVRAARVFRQYNDGTTDYGTGSSQYLYYVRACKKELVPLTSVSVADMSLAVGVTGNPVITLNPVNADVASYAWSIVSDETGVATINAATGALSSAVVGAVTVKVVVTDVLSNVRESNVATINIVNKYVDVVPVSETTTWSWIGRATGDVIITDVDTVLANYFSGAEWQKIAGKAANDQYAYRSSSYDCYQGTYLYFKAAVPGMLTINTRYASSGAILNVNGNEIATLPGEYTEYKVAVPAGNVIIEATGNQKMRIKTMKFDTKLENYEITDNVLNGYTRNVNPQYYGTICLPKAGVIAGATLFEIAYMDYKDDAPYKVYYDEVLNGELEAGMPYIFLAHESTIGVFYTDDAEETAKDKNGLHGTLEDITSGMNGENKYMLYNNQVLHSTSPESMLPANRAYIQLNEVDGYNNPNYHAAPAKPGRRRISTGFNAPQIATGLEDAAANEKPVKVLINGELYILRGEKMYDATGRLVK